MKTFAVGVRALAVVVALLVANSLSQPQSAAAELGHVAHVGVLNPESASHAMEEMLRKGLRKLGYVEGQNLALEWRRGAGASERMRAMAEELDRAGMDVIVTLGTPATKAALAATKRPLVFLMGDPVGVGVAQSLARPGGRATGVSVVYTEMITKQIELLHEIAPKAKRILFLVNLTNLGTRLAYEKLHQVAESMGLQIVTLPAANGADIEAALPRISRKAGDAVLISADLQMLTYRKEIAQAVLKAKLPAMFPDKQYHEVGALISYGPDYEASMLQISGFVDRLLRGSKPEVMPIEQVSTYELVINERIGRELGLQIPQSVLFRADKVLN